MHELGGFRFPDNIHLLKAELLALKRELAHEVKKAPPVTAKILVEIYQFVNLNSDREVVSYGCLVLGFCLFLPRSNLVPETVKGFNNSEQLVRSDVWKYTFMTMVDIRWSKTDQYRNKILNLPLVKANNKTIFPVFWLDHILNRIKATAQDPVFSYKK